jgi:death on curing protein
MTAYVTPAEAARIHAEIMARAGAASTLLDEGKLESALIRPASASYYESADLYTQAATLIAGVALAHAFNDGNKRLAAALGLIFLHINDVGVSGDHIEYTDAVLAVVIREGPLPEAIEQLATWLRMHASGIHSAE